jgi:hypothetical protein
MIDASMASSPVTGGTGRRGSWALFSAVAMSPSFVVASI